MPLGPLEITVDVLIGIGLLPSLPILGTETRRSFETKLPLELWGGLSLPIGSDSVVLYEDRGRDEERDEGRLRVREDIRWTEYRDG